MGERGSTRLTGRIVLVLLTFYALAMIAPDLLRIARPLASFGLTSNADGLIYDVQSPFAAEEDSPAWRAGVRRGDRLDLRAMRCVPVDTSLCASVLALWGGVNYVTPGSQATLILAATSDRPAREVTMIAERRSHSNVFNLILLAQQAAGILFVLGAAWLVWTRPNGMTWGFFAYSMLFNPGQAFQFYAWLRQWPTALLVQDVASCFLQAAGYTGLLLFALRAPVDRAEEFWRRIERALPVLAILFLVVALASLGSLFGYRTEFAMRASALIGFVVSVAAVLILLGRRKDLAPQDFQRIRWVIWGCLIGLPAYLIAELSLETSLPHALLGLGPAPEEVAGLFYLVNGVLCLFVVEAVRRKTVVNVSIPLRRVTLLGLALSVPALFLHGQLEAIDEFLDLPYWAWVLVASALVFLISRAHEFATHVIDRLFDRKLRNAERRLAAVGQSIERADNIAEIERLLVEEPTRSLGLASAAVFREQDGRFRRRTSLGWSATEADSFTGAERMLATRFDGEPFALEATDAVDDRDPGLPAGLARPVLGVPVGNPRRCFAILLYSGHQAGTDLANIERIMLGSLARHAEIAYAQVESELLRKRIIALEQQLTAASQHG